MGFFFFIVGVIVGTLLLVLLPLFIAVLGVALAVGIVIALPLIAAVLVIVGVIAVAPAVGYGLLIAALLIALWTSDRRRRQPRWPVARDR
jgi:antibiotic biosynthesis monooxygenase (ABM) superfamily enzyme